jgi:twitching motility protein PilT
MFDFADVLLEVLRLKASDLHLTAGSPPMVREKGRLRALDYPALTPQQTREIIYSILSGWRTTGRSTSPTRSPARAASV